MTKKSMILGTIAGLTLALSTSAAAIDDPVLSPAALKSAEKDFIELCSEDDNNDYTECKCVQRVMKEELPTKQYHLLMDLVAHGYADEKGHINLEDEDVEALIEKHDAGFFTFLSFVGNMVSAADEFDACGVDTKRYELRT